MASLTEVEKAGIVKFERNLRRIYNGLKQPDGTSDMSFEDFRKEFISLGDPSKMRIDMESIALQKQIQQSAVSLN